MLKVNKIQVPPDKSISHRAVMLASISKGTTHIKNLLMGDDVLRTMEAFRAMGVSISAKRHRDAADVVIRGVGMKGLKMPRGAIYLGNSGTTMRILPGILAAQDFQVILKGDASLSTRPMMRILDPLKKMGACISGLKCKVNGKKDIRPPLKIKGSKLGAIKYKSSIASAQVKSCVLLAGLFAKGITKVSEPVMSRDHTERMLRGFGIKCQSFRLGGQAGVTASLKGPAKLMSPRKVEIPGDISSAAFFIVGGCILPARKTILKNIGLNPTRTGVIDILKRMGAELSIKRKSSGLRGDEPVGDIIVTSSRLKGVAISPKEVVRAIDEIPIIMVAACFAKGVTVIKGINELRVKETDRARSMVTNLKKIGADIRLKDECIVINGGKRLHGARVSSFGDHRTAMSMLIASRAIKGNVTVTGLSCINKSFPGFEGILNKIT